MSTVQRIGRGSTVNGDTLVFGSNVVAGNHVIVGMFHNGGTNTLSDSQGNTYTRIDPFTSLSGAAAIQFFWAPIASSGALTITVAVASGLTVAVQAYEVSGRAASPYNSLESQACGSSTTQETGAFTPPSDNCFLLFGIRTDSAPTMTGPTSFTQAASPNNGVYFFADYTQPTAASINPTVTNGGTPTVGDVYCALFTAAGGGGGGSANKITHGLVNGGLVNGGLVS